MARNKGEGRIFKRGNVYYLRYKVNGKERTVSLKVSHLRNKKEKDGTLTKGAESLAAEYLEPLKAKTKAQIAVHIAEARQLVSSAKKITIADTWTEFIRKYRKQIGREIASGTQQNYLNHWGRFTSWLKGNYPAIQYLSEISSTVAKEYTEHLVEHDKLSSSTYNQHRGTLLLVSKTLHEDAGLSGNVWLKTQRMKKKGISRKHFTEEELDDILSAWDTKEFSIRFKDEYRVLFHIGAYTGQRLGDCCLLKWEQVDLKEKIIRLTPEKTKRIGRSVTIPVMPELEEVLHGLKKDGIKGEYICPGIAKAYMHYPTGVKRDTVYIFKDVCGYETTVKVPGRKQPTSVIGFHSFRGTLASRMLNAGVPVAVVKEIIGDNLKTIEDHYLKTGVREVKQAIDILQGARRKIISRIENADSDTLDKVMKVLFQAS